MGKEYKIGSDKKDDEVKSLSRTKCKLGNKESLDPAAAAWFLFGVTGLAMLIVKGVVWWVRR